MKTKTCSRCKRKLPSDNCHFYVASNTKDKLHSACKECEGHKFSIPKLIAKKGFKICSCCKRELPSDNKHFFVNTGEKSSKSGLSPRCKECFGYEFIIREFNPVVNGYKVCPKCNKKLPHTTEYYHSNGKKLRAYCKDCQSKIAKKQYKDNAKSKREYCRRWYKANLSDNPEHKIKSNIRATRYRIANQHTQHYKDMQIEKSERRRSIKKNLISTFTNTEWYSCKKIFNNECAYCGKHLKGLSQDHVIPVKKGGNYTKQNIVPACRSCNSSKRDKDMETWYKKQIFYNPKRLDKIYKWIGFKNNTQQLKFI